MIRAWQGSPIAADWRAQWWVVFAVGAALRLTGLTASAVWYDEAYTWAIARLPLLEMVQAVRVDYWPPLWFLIEWPLARLDTTELGLRAPAALAGIAGLWLARRLGEDLGLAPRAILLGSGLLAVLPYQLWMAQDGRVYALLSALYLAAVLFGLRRRWLGFAGASGLMLFAHPVAVFYLAAANAVVGWRLRTDRRAWPRWALANLGALAAFSVWVPSLLGQARQDFWLGRLSWDDVLLAMHLDWFAYSLPPAWDLWALLVLSASLAVAVAVVRRGPLAELAVLALGPIALMVAVSPLRNVIFYRPLSAAAAPMVLLVTGAIACLRLRPVRWAAYGLWLNLALIGVLTWSPAAKGDAVRVYARLIADEWRPGDVLYHATATSLLPFDFYLRRPAHVIDESVPGGLLSNPAQDALGVPRAALEALPGSRAWVIYARDPLLPARVVQRMDAYIRGARLIGRVRYWQAAPIEIYLLQESRE